MDRNTHRSAMITAFASAKLWKSAFFLAAISNILIAFAILTINKKEKTIIVPPGIAKSTCSEDQQIWVDGEEFSPGYVERIGISYIQFLLTYHKTNARFNFDKVLNDMDPTLYSEMKPVFDADADRIESNAISSVFYPSSRMLDEKSLTITGLQIVSVGSVPVDSRSRTYRLRFKYVAGKPAIVGYTELIQESRGKFVEIKPEPLNVNSESSPVQIDADSTSHDGVGGVIQ